MRLKAIGRFVEEQFVSIETLGNLIQVDGENRNTGGSSGSGKSTIFNALDYLLGLNNIPVTVLQSRITKDPIHVEGDFDLDGIPLTISRGKSGLKIDLNGEVTSGSSTLTEEKLDQIIGMPRDLFRKILHKRQKEGGFFLDFTPKNMYGFLSSCLNLESIQKKLEIVSNSVTKLETEKISVQSQVDTNRAALKATQDSILSLGLAPVRDIHQSVILELKNKYDASNAILSKTIEDHKAQNILLDSKRPELLPNPVPEIPEQLAPPIMLTNEVDDASQVEELQLKINQISQEIAHIREQENIRRQKLSESIQERKLAISALSHKCTLAATAKTQAAEVAGEIKKIRDAICPTCEQIWVTETAKIKEVELLNKLNQFKSQIDNGSNAELLIKKIELEISELTISQRSDEEYDYAINAKTNQIEQLDIQITEQKQAANDRRLSIASKNIAALDEYKKAQNAINHAAGLRNLALSAEVATKNKALQDEYQIKVTSARDLQAKALEQARGQAEVDKRALDIAVQKLKAFEEANRQYVSTLESIKLNEATYQSKLNELEDKLSSILTDIANDEELKKGIKTFLSCSFDDALESIGASATKIIRCIPTMSNATIQFEGQKETQKGTVKEEVNAVISMDGDIGIPIKSLSGGERSAVDLAVDLAVIDFIESETGKGIDVFILDEPFTGLDTVGIEMALEVLKNSNSNKKLIVVDHNPEVKQMVSNRLVVVREGTTSTINQEVVNG